MGVVGVYQHTREPAPAWLDELQRLAPPGGRASSLTLRWVPGTPEVPIQRWVVFECVPVHVAQQLPVWMDYQARVQADPHDFMVRWAAQMVERDQALPVPLWVVQGPSGGHPYKYTPAEEVLAKAGLLPREIAAIGELPYAEPNHHVWTALHQRRTLLQQVPDPYTARELVREVALRQARAAQLAHTTERMGEVMEDALPDVMASAQYVTQEDARGTAARVDDETFARYLETGDLTPA